MGGERPAFFGNEFREQIGLAGGDQFLNLLFRDLALENHFGDAEGAGLLSRQEFELGFVFLGGEDEVGGEFIAALGNEILNQR
jgi:hypothetical protein